MDVNYEHNTVVSKTDRAYLISNMLLQMGIYFLYHHVLCMQEVGKHFLTGDLFVSVFHS